MRKASIHESRQVYLSSAYRSFDLLAEIIEKGNPNSVTDAAVGVLATRACIRGAFLNVRINVKELKDRNFTDMLLSEERDIDQKAEVLEEKLVNMAG